MPLVEARVPAYKHSGLLHRALQSLRDQTHSDWVAVVFDDSSEQEGRQVVHAFNDDRIEYQPNNKNLGRAANIDHAFQTNPCLGGEYAFVLEDDNYLFPEFIAENLREIERQRLNIILRN